MEGLIGFLKGFVSMLFAAIIIVGLIGAIVSTDVVFKVAGVAGLIVWLVILIRTMKHHTIDGKGHTNYL